MSGTILAGNEPAMAKSSKRMSSVKLIWAFDVCLAAKSVRYSCSYEISPSACRKISAIPCEYVPLTFVWRQNQYDTEDQYDTVRVCALDVCLAAKSVRYSCSYEISPSACRKIIAIPCEYVSLKFVWRQNQKISTIPYEYVPLTFVWRQNQYDTVAVMRSRRLPAGRSVRYRAIMSLDVCLAAKSVQYSAVMSPRRMSGGKINLAVCLQEDQYDTVRVCALNVYLAAKLEDQCDTVRVCALDVCLAENLVRYSCSYEISPSACRKIIAIPCEYVSLKFVWRQNQYDTVAVMRSHRLPAGRSYVPLTFVWRQNQYDTVAVMRSRRLPAGRSVRYRAIMSLDVCLAAKSVQYSAVMSPRRMSGGKISTIQLQKISTIPCEYLDVCLAEKLVRYSCSYEISPSACRKISTIPCEYLDVCLAEKLEDLYDTVRVYALDVCLAAKSVRYSCSYEISPSACRKISAIPCEYVPLKFVWRQNQYDTEDQCDTVRVCVLEVCLAAKSVRYSCSYEISPSACRKISTIPCEYVPLTFVWRQNQYDTVAVMRSRRLPAGRSVRYRAIMSLDVCLAAKSVQYSAVMSPRRMSSGKINLAVCLQEDQYDTVRVCALNVYLAAKLEDQCDTVRVCALDVCLAENLVHTVAVMRSRLCVLEVCLAAKSVRYSCSYEISPSACRKISTIPCEYVPLTFVWRQNQYDTVAVMRSRRLPAGRSVRYRAIMSLDVCLAAKSVQYSAVMSPRRMSGGKISTIQLQKISTIPCEYLDVCLAEKLVRYSCSYEISPSACRKISTIPCEYLDVCLAEKLEDLYDTVRVYALDVCLAAKSVRYSCSYEISPSACRKISAIPCEYVPLKFVWRQNQYDTVAVMRSRRLPAGRSVRYRASMCP
ncbi:hypothetical protein J6590_067093 [Homalodisca vitripennis]|nr:hypothetical protein J6590_067093 [Homalodisca vitripennis]